MLYACIRAKPPAGRGVLSHLTVTEHHRELRDRQQEQNK